MEIFVNMLIPVKLEVDDTYSVAFDESGQGYLVEMKDGGWSVVKKIDLFKPKAVPEVPEESPATPMYQQY